MWESNLLITSQNDHRQNWTTQSPVTNQSIKIMTKFQTETRHQLPVNFHKKTTTTMATMNSAKCETKACTHGVFCPLTQE